MSGLGLNKEIVDGLQWDGLKPAQVYAHAQVGQQVESLFGAQGAGVFQCAVGPPDLVVESGGTLFEK